MNTSNVFPVHKPKKSKLRPNRIFELMKDRNLTYAEVAEKIRKIAAARNITGYTKVHEVTINRLALGKAKLTQDWMNMFGDAFNVPPHEIIAAPLADNLRRVRVIYALEAGRWMSSKTMPDAEQFDIMIPSDHQLEDLDLYAGEIRGQHFNLRYPDKSLVVLSKIAQKPDEIVEGKRYHVRTSRADGQAIETIRSLARDTEGKYWLRPESNHPAHQEWLPIAGTAEYKVEIVGRVRGVFFREE